MDGLKRLLARLDKVGIWFPAVILASFVIFIVAYTSRHVPAVLAPRGVVAAKERTLILFALGLAAVVVVPVFTLLLSFAWRYREGNEKSRASYKPELSGNRAAETVWWLIPGILILILSIVTWNSSHDLDPYKPLVSDVQPMTIQVVAEDWKWLFIYPEEHIATVNYVMLPVNVPVNFVITSDTVMNSFWIPQLGGQIYAMPGMSTQLHLMASSDGDFNGSSANISGSGFAAMHFIAHADSAGVFNDWVQTVRQSPLDLSAEAYQQLAKPGENAKPVYFSSVDNGLYATILGKYMSDGMGAMSGMEM